ncbi:MAG: hypothetical protein Q9213_001069 [Squamulea squamosa]
MRFGGVSEYRLRAKQSDSQQPFGTPGGLKDVKDAVNNVKRFRSSSDWRRLTWPLIIAINGLSLRTFVPWMDPVSIAASAIAFIHACRKLAAGFRFLNDISQAPKDILALTDELDDLQNTLTAVGLMTRKRQDDITSSLLMPFLHKVDRIIHELCHLCGACPQKLKEDDGYGEQLKLHLQARFKWTLAKKRVNELHERLKVVRLDLSNSLAATCLLDISHLTDEVRTLSDRLAHTTLLEAQPQLHNPPPYEATSMIFTTQTRGHLDLCRFLLKAGARPEITDIEEKSVTDMAWNKICLKKVSSSEVQQLEEIFKKDDWFEERQFTLLHKIVLDLLPSCRDLEEELSMSTKDINTADSEGRTPLSWAAELGNFPAVQTLLRYGASTSSRSINGMTALHDAARAPTSACLLALLNHGASVSAHNKWKQSPLNIACYSQNDETFVNALLDHGADIDERDYYGSTALSGAVFMNQFQTARCLLERGASTGTYNLNVMNDAIENNSHECISLLLQYNANLSTANVHGETSLHVLARRGDLRSIKSFQMAGIKHVDLEAKTKEKFTAWDVMRQRADVTDEVEIAFRGLMAKLQPGTDFVQYFDAEEKIPTVAGKVSDLVEFSAIMLSFLLPVILLPYTACAAETILGVYIFSRHGDRTAKSTPPANLTNLGYSQVFTSGTYFRNRYIAANGTSRIAGVNSDIVKQSQITVSAPFDTVLMNSAQGFLQGLYPPVGSRMGSDTLRDGRIVQSPLDGYQLIPVQPVTSGTGSEDSAWLQGSSNCAQALVSSNEYFTSSDYNDLRASTSEFYKSLTPLIGATFNADQISYKNAYTIFDLLNVASTHNSSLPDDPLLADSTLVKLRTLADHHELSLAYNSTDPIRAIAGSTLAAQIVQGLDNTIISQGKSKITIEFGAYASFLSFFGLANLLTLPDSNESFLGIPDYASTMTFELFTTADTASFPAVEDLQVRFLFHNGTTDEKSTPTAYPLFGQSSTELSWTEFRDGMNRFAVGGQEQWCRACGNSTGVCASVTASSSAGAGTGASATGSSSGSGNGISTAVAGVIGAMVTLAVVLGLQAAMMLGAGLRVVRKNRLAGSQTDESVNGEVDERKS